MMIIIRETNRNLNLYGEPEVKLALDIDEEWMIFVWLYGISASLYHLALNEIHGPVNYKLFCPLCDKAVPEKVRLTYNLFSESP